MTASTRPALLLEAILELRYRRGRLAKVTVDDVAVVLDVLDKVAPAASEPDWLIRAGLVAAESDRATAMHGEPADLTGRDWLAILAEEFGEVAAEVTKGEVPPVNRDRRLYLTNLHGELIQTASVAMRWLAATDVAIAELDR